MRNFIIVLVCSCFLNANGQINPVDFEAGGAGASWTWTVFENASNPALEIVDNPDASGINTSSTVAKFTALQAGQPFAGCETMHGSDIGTFTLTSDNAFVTIMVYKTAISDVGIKFATNPGASTGELKIPNTLINQWEKLVFDFTSIIGEPSSTDIDQLIVFPDFTARSEDRVIYFDNIVFGDSTLSVNDNQINGLKMYPNPAIDILSFTAVNRLESIRIHNQFGQEVLQASPQRTSANISISSLASGIYFVSIENESGQKAVKKLIKR